MYIEGVQVHRPVVVTVTVTTTCNLHIRIRIRIRIRTRTTRTRIRCVRAGRWHGGPAAAGPAQSVG